VAGPAANNPGPRAVLRRHAPSATRQRTLEANGIDCGASVLRSGLRRERYGSRSAERAGELGEDRQVGMEPDAIQAPDAERSQAPLRQVLLVAEYRTCRPAGLSRQFPNERPAPVGLSSTWTRPDSLGSAPLGAAEAHVSALPRRSAAPGVRLGRSRRRSAEARNHDLPELRRPADPASRACTRTMAGA
jgi:hypothetical protein